MLVTAMGRETSERGRSSALQPARTSKMGTVTSHSRRMGVWIGRPFSSPTPSAATCTKRSVKDERRSHKTMDMAMVMSSGGTKVYSMSRTMPIILRVLLYTITAVMNCMNSATLRATTTNSLMLLNSPPRIARHCSLLWQESGRTMAKVRATQETVTTMNLPTCLRLSRRPPSVALALFVPDMPQEAQAERTAARGQAAGARSRVRAGS
mmetsp:Transcript_41651/g.120850  ORF Transcript_41651/g.120850 Transcript_41651/m.120850 type:complete len:209 (+) Transcript_41651:410-1036(+)